MSAGAGVKWSIWILCICGAARVLLFSAAYPVFDFIDEGLHLEVVLKFDRVGLPGRGQDLFDPLAARYVATYGLYHLAPPYTSPFEGLPSPKREAAIANEADGIASWGNAETFAPPVYYALAAGWYRLGRAIGLTDLALLYWVRFLSAPFYAARSSPSALD